MTKTTKNVPTVAGNSPAKLPAAGPERAGTWGAVARVAPELPAEYTEDMDTDDREAVDDNFVMDRATPEVREQTSLGGRQALRQLALDAKRLCAPPPEPKPEPAHGRSEAALALQKLMAAAGKGAKDEARRDQERRVEQLETALSDGGQVLYDWLTLENFHEVSPYLIAADVAEATRIRPAVVYRIAREAVDYFLEERGEEKAEPTFDHRDFGSMADFVRRGVDLTAAGANRFFFKDREVESFLVELDGPEAVGRLCALRPQARRARPHQRPYRPRGSQRAGEEVSKNAD